jgi:hypothetical protein
MRLLHHKKISQHFFWLVSLDRWQSPISRVFIQNVFFICFETERRPWWAAPHIKSGLPSVPVWSIFPSEWHVWYCLHRCRDTHEVSICSKDTSLPPPASETAQNSTRNVLEPTHLFYKQHYLVTMLYHLLPFKMNRCYFCSKLNCKTFFFSFF